MLEFAGEWSLGFAALGPMPGNIQLFTSSFNCCAHSCGNINGVCLKYELQFEIVSYKVR
jgi:hypothetical protein